MNSSADLILYNGKIITIDTNEAIHEAVACLFGRFLAIGATNDILRFKGEKTKIIDLQGKSGIPGLIDSHSHMIANGLARKLYIDLSMESGIRSISDIQDRLRSRAKKVVEGEWIIGYQEDDSKLKEKRHPTRKELDEVSRKHPVMVETVGGHFRVVNSKAFENRKITKETPDPVGGKFDRDKNTGEFTGGIHEKAIDLVLDKGGDSLPREKTFSAVKEILEECASVGLTCVYDSAIDYLIDARTQIRAALDLKNNNELPIRVRLDITTELMPDLDKLGINQGLGDDWLRICGLKFFFDGAISARTAAVTEAYENNPDFFGVMATTKEIAKNTLTEAYDKGFRISAHANGDKAIDIYLDIIEELQKKYPNEKRRNRDIHCSVVRKDIVERIRDLEILPTIFGPYIYYHGDKILPAFGEKRSEWMFASRSFLDNGVKLSAHSDHPCAPLPPLMALQGLVTRKTKSGENFGISQRISISEALKLYTINAAYHSFDEDKLGSIEVGKLADMVILGKDILTVDPDKIIDIPIEMTIIEGRIVFQKTN
ncbi:MAG: amidohydrolase [Candidatus Hodarchaeales archaeon]|jgi:predicted amidohydrolase YtcJ